MTGEWATVRPRNRGCMRLEYFLLIDRIVEFKLSDQTIRTEATVPTTSRSSRAISPVIR
jgi:hypothetical protein